MEAVLQLEKKRPAEFASSQSPKAIKSIRIIESDPDVVRMLAEELEEVKAIWDPKIRIEGAKSHWLEANRRLLCLPSSPHQHMRNTRVTFPLRHRIPRNLAMNYRCNIKCTLWRTQKVHQPPPFLVNVRNGGAANKQLSARPFYRLGVGYDLFPSRTNGLRTVRSVRRNLEGKVVGDRRRFRIDEGTYWRQ